MSAPPIFPRAIAPLALAVLAAIAACSAVFSLPPATLPTAKGTVTLWALTGTDLAHPSAYDLMQQIVARTDRTSAFDFAFDIRVDSLHDTSAVLLPRGALGLYVDGGLQITTQPFDSITIAPTSGYQDTSAVVVKVGTVVLAASRQQTCNFGYIRPLYAKLHVTALDLVARSITFDILTDPNCGYRSLKADSLPPKE
jgi:hypothetical protein